MWYILVLVIDSFCWILVELLVWTLLYWPERWNTIQMCLV